MSQIDPARLSRVLGSLIKPRARADASSKPENTAQTRSGQTASARDPAVLRRRLEGRLKALKENDMDFAQNAPIVTVQEILRWEFGDTVIGHPEFERIAAHVTQTMLENVSLGEAMRRLIEDMTG